MNDPWSSNGRGGAAKQATTDVSDLGQQEGDKQRPRRGLTWKEGKQGAWYCRYYRRGGGYPRPPP